MERELTMKQKDDTRRQNFKSKSVRSRQLKDTAEQTAVHVNKETEPAKETLSSAPHMIIRSAVYHMRIAPIIFPKVSTYIPSFYMYYFTLQSAHAIVHDNTYLRYLSPQYISIGSSLYYGMLGFIQILRAKTVAGIITRPESQALRRFEREFPFESLPIMSPLIMFFQNLGAVKLADPMYSWICPSLPEEIGTGPNVTGIFNSDDNIMLPNVPALIRFLSEIGNAQTLAQITDLNRIVPTSAQQGNTNFFGINLAANTPNTNSKGRLTYSAGWLEPPELPESLDVKVIRRIQRWNLPTLTSTTDLRQIGQFIQTDGNMEWFARLINLVTEEVKFFKGSTNLAAIPPVAGLSSLTEITLKDQTPPEASTHLYPFNSPDFNSDLWKYEMTTTRGESTAEEAQIGSTTQFIVSQFGNLTPTNHPTPDPTLNGPYFGTPAEARQVAQIESDTTRSPRIAFEQIIRENLYLENGGQNSTSNK